jgi:hypothetical protein
MSLVTSASPWINDNNNISKKRTPTMRRTLKLKPTNTLLSEEPEEYVSQIENYQNQQPTSIEDTQNQMDQRNTRVNDLLDKITSANSEDDNKLASFNPLPNPNINNKKDMNDVTMPRNYVPPIHTYTNASNSHKNGPYMANDGTNSIYSNYRMSYEKPLIYGDKNQYLKNIQGSPNVQDNKLLEKINYMIMLLEEQQHEKTSNITEEFILYTFLGVFIIFIVDSFARSGKYIR